MHITKRSLLSLALFMAMTLSSYAQQKKAPIVVRDAETLLPLPGVMIENITNDAVDLTQDDGKFELENNDLKEIKLRLSYIGYFDKEITIKAGAYPSFIDLDIEDNILEGIVVTGYTKQSRSKTTGAVSKIEAQAINRSQVSSMDQALQGQVPGLYVASPSGQPGTPGRVTIRGIGSMQDENTNPLYVLNGIPISPATFSALNPDDFEDITVLKDAAATAQYGSRGANGVIVITSKKGPSDNDGMRVTYQTQYGYSEANNSKWDMMNTNQRLQFEEMLQDQDLPGWAYSRNNPYKVVNGVQTAKTEADYADGDLRLAELRRTNIDWKKKLMRRGINQSHNLSFQGGNAETQHYTSVNYFKQDGVLYNSGIEKFNVNSNIHNKSGRLSSNFFINLANINSQTSESDFDVSETNPVASMYFALPYENPYDENGKLTPGANRFGTNALAMYDDVSRREKQQKAVLAGNFSFDITDDLKLTSTLGVDYTKLSNTHIIKPDTYFGDLVEEGGQGMYSQGDQTNIGLMANFGANYKYRWGANELEAIALMEMNRQKYNYHGFTGYGLIDGLDHTAGGITPGTPENDFIPKVEGRASENLLLSQIGLLRYSYENRFTLSTSLRRDGSSRVPSNNRYKYFYAVGGSWNMKVEDFMQDIDIISMARLRTSYGLTGNANGFASDFGYRRLYGPGQYNGGTAFNPLSPGNSQYNWEMNKILDIGVEFGLFNNRLIGEVDFYNRITSDLFLDRTLSNTSGFESIADNMGKIRNRGIEFKISGDVIRSGDFTFNLGVNFAYNKNKILSLGDEDEIITEDYSIHQVGKQVGHFYMVKWAGVDQQTGAPLYYDKEGNITSTYDPDNAVLVKGGFDPAIKGGFTTNFKYKNLEVSALFSFIKGMYRLNTGEFYRTSADQTYRIYNQSTGMLDMWQNPGDVSDNPSAKYARYMTDRELQKADYLKLRNLNINYKFKDFGKWNKVVKEVNIFAQGQNLLTWTNFKGQDPEDDNNWYQYEYPLPRTITAGIKVIF
ncbi:SusC/RagA family TonB-linked outer membrane protein [Myroides sp. M-43]|uniref:SusC/RagA family TonB-linked outer membrane protein n=1 Tax=Myroides oncorhynchi TaxID=2893756 RepID=UPI001E286984|nr:SusC/RagA family TonB-linked outer membrane protein [Myroides oncorhynchi]MCC9043277.1 SusC/RagA family TonB-linked outer membrane protein [Myroides oncorhynchi]